MSKSRMALEGVFKKSFNIKYLNILNKNIKFRKKIINSNSNS